MDGDPGVPAARPASVWRSVALPREHGGWGLTLEPVVLGLAVAGSPPGMLLGMAAFGAFLARTPLKVAAVDARRHQWRARSGLAVRIAAVELAVIAAAVVATFALAGARWVLPVAIAAPLVAVEAVYDARSRSRRLLPELCGAIGIAATAAAIVLADRDDVALATALWMVLIGRSVGSIPFVRAQIARLHRHTVRNRDRYLAPLAAVVVGAVALAVDDRVLVGVVALVVITAVELWWARRPLPPVEVIGFQQLGLGLALVTAAAIGVHVA